MSALTLYILFLYDLLIIAVLLQMLNGGHKKAITSQYIHIPDTFLMPKNPA